MVGEFYNLFKPVQDTPFRGWSWLEKKQKGTLRKTCHIPRGDPKNI